MWLITRYWENALSHRHVGSRGEFESEDLEITFKSYVSGKEEEIYLRRFSRIVITVYQINRELVNRKLFLN